jgi:hypothetical protein
VSRHREGTVQQSPKNAFKAHLSEGVGAPATRPKEAMQ